VDVVDYSNTHEAQLTADQENTAETEDMALGNVRRVQGKFCSAAALKTLWSLLESQ